MTWTNSVKNLTWTPTPNGLIKKSEPVISELSFITSLLDSEVFTRDIYIDRVLLSSPLVNFKTLKKPFKSLFKLAKHNAEFRRVNNSIYSQPAFTVNEMLDKIGINVNDIFHTTIKDFSDDHSESLVLSAREYEYYDIEHFRESDAAAYLVFFYKKDGALEKRMYEGFLQEVTESHFVLKTPLGFRKFHKKRIEGFLFCRQWSNKIVSKSALTSDLFNSQFAKLTLHLTPISFKKAKVTLTLTI